MGGNPIIKHKQLMLNSSKAIYENIITCAICIAAFSKTLAKIHIEH